MTVFFDSSLEVNLNDFGILIPIYSRGNKIAKELPEIVRDLKLLMPKSFEPHSCEYITKLQDSESLKKEVTKTFELINKEGEFVRYDPTQAKLGLDVLGEILLKKSSGAHLASEFALKKGFSFFLGGGMHHAYEDRGRGFCLVHDVMMSAVQYPNRKIGIIDLDVHKGDGTAVLASKFENIKTLSIHMAHGWPLDGDKNLACFTPSDWDIPIEESHESDYLNQLKKCLDSLDQFDLVYVLAGTDPYEKDSLESSKGIKLKLEELLKRDLMVYQKFKKQKIPQAWVLSGGYGPDSSEPTINFLRKIFQ